MDRQEFMDIMYLKGWNAMFLTHETLTFQSTEGKIIQVDMDDKDSWQKIMQALPESGTSLKKK